MAPTPAKQHKKAMDNTLADYLDESGPRVITQFGTTEVYPTDEARSIIQGIVTSVLDLKCENLEHNHLLHPENYVLKDKRYHPYSNYVRNLSTGDVLQNRKLLQKADEQYPETIEVKLEHNKKGLKCDDFKALKFIIFDVILTVDGRKPLLSAEWEEFRSLFSKSELNYALIASHSCLWGFKKRLNFYKQLDDWANPSKANKKIKNLVFQALRSMPILSTEWAKRLQKDKHLAKFAKISITRQRKVYGYIRVFRNLVEHCQETASAVSPYKDGRYVDYVLRRLFPTTLEDIHRRLLRAGFIY